MLDCSLFFFIHSSNFGVGVMRKKRKLVCRDIVRGGEFKFFYARNNKFVFPWMRVCGWRSKRKGNFMLEIFEHLFDIDSISFDWTNDFGEFETCNSTCRENRVDVLYTYPCQGKLSELVKGFGIRSSGKYECSLISRIAINILQLLRATFSSLLQTMYYRNTGWQNLWPPRCDQPRCRREWGICWLKICCDPLLMQLLFV